MGASMDASTEALAVAHEYHDAWTTRRFDDAVRLLAPTLRVEVPINSYPMGRWARVDASRGTLHRGRGTDCPAAANP
jgi:hypothetical protein